MALIVRDRVMETTTTTGTGALTLAAAVTGYRRFSDVCATSDTVYYAIEGIDGSGNPTGEWEVGLGTYSSANTLTRTTPAASSNAGAAVNLSAGTKLVRIEATVGYLATLSAVAYTDEQAQDAVGGILTDSSTVDFTYNDAGGSITASVIQAALKPTETIIIACSDETTAVTTGTAKVTFRMPYAFTLSAVRASVTTAPTGSTLIVDINESGSTILSTKLSIDASEKTSTTAATAAVISDTSLADDAEITIDFDQVGSTIAGAGVKVYLIGSRT